MSSNSPSKRHSLWMSTIESSVTRLLVATKHLLESLTQWAKHSATEGDISDSYVQLGNEFKVACRAFSSAGVDVSDLGDVPHALRVVLEEALCDPPSQESLDKFLPSIREIIVNLLQNLKSKQALARTLKENKSRDNLKNKSQESLRRSSSTVDQQNASPDNSSNERGSISSHKTTVQHSATPSTVGAVATSTPQKGQQVVHKSTDTQSKSKNDALTQLQKGDSLQRRASRRFSAYQYAKLASYSPGRDPELPDHSIIERSKSLRNSPVQNRSFSSQQNGDNQARSEIINIFLKIGDRVKKCTITTPITFTSLRLLFVEKFAYSPGSDAFPDIYIQDPGSNVAYELEEHLFSDVQEQSVISLNINKDYMTLEQLNKKINELKESIDKKDDYLQNTKDYIDETNSGLLEKLQTILETASLSAAAASSDKKATTPVKEVKRPQNIAKSGLFSEMSDLLDIRHELSVIKQINNTNKVQFKESIELALQKVREFKSLSLDASKSSNRTYMEESHSKLSKESDALLTKFDDLQDLVEALRKDVAQRGARPSEKQLDFVTKQVAEAKADLDHMVKFIETEKPNWKKIWESELDTVCQEQQFLTLQEDLAFDLKEDLEKVTETFDLVKNVCEEQSKNPKTRHTNLPLAEPGSLPNLRDALLSEVVALKPNHEDRLEAIEKAEKLREKERQLAMSNEFEEELGGFVSEHRLKKSGGIEEIERQRRLKDEQNLRSAIPPLF